jgi:hypothetical protein
MFIEKPLTILYKIIKIFLVFFFCLCFYKQLSHKKDTKTGIMFISALRNT